MKVKVIEKFATAKGIIPEGTVIEIEEKIYPKLQGKVIPIPASEYAQSLLVKCPLSGGDLHCWHCSRCHKMETCPAIPDHLQQKVKGYTERRKPQSLHWTEGRLPLENSTLPAWEDICHDYWEGCFDCQSYKPASISYGFCSKYNREGKLLS